MATWKTIALPNVTRGRGSPLSHVLLLAPHAGATPVRVKQAQVAPAAVVVMSKLVAYTPAACDSVGAASTVND